MLSSEAVVARIRKSNLAIFDLDGVSSFSCINSDKLFSYHGEKRILNLEDHLSCFDVLQDDESPSCAWKLRNGDLYGDIALDT